MNQEETPAEDRPVVKPLVKILADAQAIADELTGFAQGSESARASLMRDGAASLAQMIELVQNRLKSYSEGYADGYTDGTVQAPPYVEPTTPEERPLFEGIAYAQAETIRTLKARHQKQSRPKISDCTCGPGLVVCHDRVILDAVPDLLSLTDGSTPASAIAFREWAKSH